ncbi:hypothetical protein LI951_12095 [Enterococcus sp. BWT-B8]|uniref:hypothetical protein n=1 Tax=Enterococcus sp. BWT-B8 TaxID=2885157 RepID=UPI001E4C4779|nr:hypothetical protein [Enterococcus sp. BWT-B8]MCB5952810.1 hypothetical protein [Enterococcus sp. BWT-B8]
MGKKIKHFSFVGIFTTLFTFALGYFLQTILFPIQDLNTLSKEELLKTQKEAALNYDLGIVLMKISLVLLIIFVFIYLFLFFLNCKNKFATYRKK